MRKSFYRGELPRRGRAPGDGPHGHLAGSDRVTVYTAVEAEGLKNTRPASMRIIRTSKLIGFRFDRYRHGEVAGREGKSARRCHLGSRGDQSSSDEGRGNA